MLEAIPSRNSRRRIFRLANVPLDGDFIAELEIDSEGNDELREMLAAVGHSANPNELCDGPFRPKRRLRRRTRFSDGSFPVFYSSLDAGTADAEVRYWLPNFMGKPQVPRKTYFQRFSCTFDGMDKDLRPKVTEWPDLTHRCDYTFCNQLGAEARKLGIDGLVTLSARCDGTNLPIFKRQAISNPEMGDVVAMTFYPDTGEVTIR